MQTWLDKLCEPLEHPKYPQITGILVRYDSSNNIIGKCAEGEIACQNNIMIKRDQDQLEYHQLGLLGVPEDFLSIYNLPYLWSYAGLNFEFEQSGCNIGHYIWKLNDKGYTYPEIVEFLRTTFEDAV